MSFLHIISVQIIHSCVNPPKITPIYTSSSTLYCFMNNRLRWALNSRDSERASLISNVKYHYAFIVQKRESKNKKRRPRCGLNRTVKLTVTHTVQLRFLLYFLSFCERSAREMWHSYRRHLLLHNNRLPLRETWLSLPAHGGVMLQRVGFEKNVNRHFSLNIW